MIIHIVDNDDVRRRNLKEKAGRFLPDAEVKDHCTLPAVLQQWDLAFLHLNNMEGALESTIRTAFDGADKSPDRRTLLYTGGGRTADLDPDRVNWRSQALADGHRVSIAFDVSETCDLIRIEEWVKEKDQVRGHVPSAEVFVNGSVPPVYEAKLAILFELINDAPESEKIEKHLKTLEDHIRPDGDLRYWERQERFDSYVKPREDLPQRRRLREKSPDKLRDLMLHGSEG